MKKNLLLFFSLVSFLSFAQTKVSGLVFDEYLEPLPGVTIKSENGETALSDFEGTFTITVKKFPTTLTVTSVGYQNEIVELEDASQEINVILKESLGLDQVVLSASRTPERVLESPVTIERIGQKDIKNTSSLNFYEGLGNLKGIDVLTNSYTTKLITSNRGFANAQNTRFVQLVDGAETTVPVVDYSLGNLFGLNELDVKNVEILPGAASALYGANAFNGILLMTSKNAFDDQGISAYFKTGVTTQEGRNSAGFYNAGIRLAHAFNDKIAVKTNFEYTKGEEWFANDIRNSEGQGGNIIDGQFSHADDTGYDGVNVYGDEIGFNFKDLVRNIENRFPGLLPVNTWRSPLVEDINITREGYLESDLAENKSNAIRFDGTLYFRPWGKESAEITLGSKFNLVDNVIQASNRYDQQGAFMQQHKFEIKDKNYFVRAYYTENDAGNTTDTRLAGISVLNQWKDHGTYFGQYVNEYFASIGRGSSLSQAHADARQAVELGKPLAGTPEFNLLLNNARNTSSSEENGAKIVDNTGFYHVDANYNFRDIVDFANIQVGGSFRSYALDSEGQIYTDDDGVIRYRQFGFYSQIQKKLNDDRLKLTGTIRYDKSDNVSGEFSPRATISYSAGENRGHNFRLAYQTAFRNPTTQDQYLGVQLGDRVFLGTVEENLDREISTATFRSDPSRSVTISGRQAFNNAYTAASVEAYLDAYRNGRTLPTLEVANPEFVKPETVQSFELGYRGATELAGNLFEFDIVGYYNFHKDFITTKEIFTPLEGDVTTNAALAETAIQNNDFVRYILRTNTNDEIDAFGFSVGFNTKVLGGFGLGANYAFSDFKSDSQDPDFDPGFNTPKHTVKVQFGHDKLFKNFGFNINGRWQDEFLYQSTFINGIVDERLVLDAQFNIRFPSIKSTFKFGGTNIGGDEYTSIPGASIVGSQYYVSWMINN